MNQFKVGFYRAPSKTQLIVFVREDLAPKIGPLELVSFINDETKAEVKLRRSISGNKAGPAVNRDGWLQYKFSGKNLADTPALPLSDAVASAKGDELTLVIEKTFTELEPLENVLA